MSTTDLAVAVGSAVGSYYGARKRVRTEVSSYEPEDHGITRRRVVGTRKARGKSFNLSKLLRSSIFPWTQHLVLQTETAVSTPMGTKLADCLVSEYNPATGGCVPILNSTSWGRGPMHLYDLNFVQLAAVGQDLATTYPTVATSQCTDINKRAWVWRPSSGDFAALNGYATVAGASNTVAPRWRCLAADFAADNMRNRYVYRKGICIDYMFYGCQKMETEYDIRVIQVMEPFMCPDYQESLSNTAPDLLDTYKMRWQNLIRAWTINPMLKGTVTAEVVKDKKRWFKTVAKKRIRVNEQSADTDQVQCVQGRIYVPVNEVNDMNWAIGQQLSPNYETSNVKETDTLPNTTNNFDLNATMNVKPYYGRRYYLLIRALCPYNSTTSGEFTEEGFASATDPVFTLDGRTSVKYIPTYDLNIRTTFMAQV